MRYMVPVDRTLRLSGQPLRRRYSEHSDDQRVVLTIGGASKCAGVSGNDGTERRFAAGGLPDSTAVDADAAVEGGGDCASPDSEGTTDDFDDGFAARPSLPAGKA